MNALTGSNEDMGWEDHPGAMTVNVSGYHLGKGEMGILSDMGNTMYKDVTSDGKNRNIHTGQKWQHTPIIPALKKQRKKQTHKFEATRVYIVRPTFKKKKKKERGRGRGERQNMEEGEGGRER